MTSENNSPFSGRPQPPAAGSSFPSKPTLPQQPAATPPPSPFGGVPAPAGNPAVPAVPPSGFPIQPPAPPASFPTQPPAPAPDQLADDLAQELQALRQAQEDARQRAEQAERDQARVAEERRQAELAAAASALPPVMNTAPPIPSANLMEETSKKGKRARKEKTPRGGTKTAKEERPKTEREQKYAGNRSQVFWLKAGVITTITVLCLAGLSATISLPFLSPSQEQLGTAAAETVNFTGFPDTSGERFALDFATAYWNFSTTDDPNVRTERLSAFVPNEELLLMISPQNLSEEEFRQLRDAQGLVNANGTPMELVDYQATQKINYGPYAVKVDNISETYSIFTLKIGLVGAPTYLYWDVPVMYDEEQLSLAVAGPPTFSKVIMNQGAGDAVDYTATFATAGTSDEALADEFSDDLQAYLSAWAQSDSTIIDRYLTEGAQVNARNGLSGQAQFSGLDSFYVEPENLDENPATAYQRRAEIVVTWGVLNQETGARTYYKQQYRLLLAKNVDAKWSVYDIQNFAVFK